MQIRVVFVIFPTFFPIPQKSSSSPPKSFCLTPSCCKKKHIVLLPNLCRHLVRSSNLPTHRDWLLTWLTSSQVDRLGLRKCPMSSTTTLVRWSNRRDFTHRKCWNELIHNAGKGRIFRKKVVPFKNFITNIFEYHCNINFYLYIFWISAIRVTSFFFQPMSGETEIPVRYSTSPCGISPTFLKIHSVFA